MPGNAPAQEKEDEEKGDCSRGTHETLLTHSHFTLTFDTSPRVLDHINNALGKDPMVIRWMLTKKGSAM
jgi:hypothetical protein